MYKFMVLPIAVLAFFYVDNVCALSLTLQQLTDLYAMRTETQSFDTYIFQSTDENNAIVIVGLDHKVWSSPKLTSKIGNLLESFFTVVIREDEKISINKTDQDQEGLICEEKRLSLSKIPVYKFVASGCLSLVGCILSCTYSTYFTMPTLGLGLLAYKSFRDRRIEVATWIINVKHILIKESSSTPVLMFIDKPYGAFLKNALLLGKQYTLLNFSDLLQIRQTKQQRKKKKIYQRPTQDLTRHYTYQDSHELTKNTEQEPKSEQELFEETEKAEEAQQRWEENRQNRILLEMMKRREERVKEEWNKKRKI